MAEIPIPTPVPVPVPAPLGYDAVPKAPTKTYDPPTPVPVPVPLPAPTSPYAVSVSTPPAVAICQVVKGGEHHLTGSALTSALLGDDYYALKLCSAETLAREKADKELAGFKPVLPVNTEIPPRTQFEIAPRWETNVEVSSKLPPKER